MCSERPLSLSWRDRRRLRLSPEGIKPRPCLLRLALGRYGSIRVPRGVRGCRLRIFDSSSCHMLLKLPAESGPIGTRVGPPRAEAVESSCVCDVVVCSGVLAARLDVEVPDAYVVVKVGTGVLAARLDIEVPRMSLFPSVMLLLGVSMLDVMSGVRPPSLSPGSFVSVCVCFRVLVASRELEDCVAAVVLCSPCSFRCRTRGAACLSATCVVAR